MIEQPWLAEFGTRAVRLEQTRILRAALAAIRPERPAAAFDLDSTILSNKTRQARIVRELGQATGASRPAPRPRWSPGTCGTRSGSAG